jgi:hypothetical protein
MEANKIKFKKILIILKLVISLRAANLLFSPGFGKPRYTTG